jgi:hypothetical protein
MGPIAIQKCASPEPGAELLWTKLPARNTEGTADAGGPIRLQLHVPSSSPSTDAAPQALCLTAVATTTWCGNRDVCNDELDALACNSSDPAQLWWWNSTAQIATAMPKALKDKLWSGRPGRCNGWPCCLDVNAEKAVNGQTLQGDGCPGAQFKAVPSAGSSSAFQIQVTTFGHHATPGWCVGYQPKMPPSHGPKPSPPPPPPPPPPPGQEWRDPNVYFVNQVHILPNSRYPARTRYHSLIAYRMFGQSLQNANLRSADGRCVYSPGWPGSFVMDPLDSEYLALLKEEAHRHVAMLGEDFAGVSCDRGWAQLNNAHADDGVTYCPGSKQCRSLLYSQRKAMEQIGGIFHAAGKLISYNPVQVRISDCAHSNLHTNLKSGPCRSQGSTSWSTTIRSSPSFRPTPEGGRG